MKRVNKILPSDSQFFNNNNISQSRSIISIDNIRNMIVSFKGDAKKLNLILKWVLKFHQDKFREAFKSLSYASPQVIEKMEFFKGKIFVNKCLVNKTKYNYFIKTKINNQIVEEKLITAEIKGTKERLLLDQFKYNIFLSIIANDFNEQQIIKKGLTDIIENFKKYYDLIKEEIALELQLLSLTIIAIKFLTPDLQIKFIKKHEEILDKATSSTAICYAYTDLLLDLNELNKIESLIQVILNNKEDSNSNRYAALLYHKYTEKLINLSETQIVWENALKSYEQFQQFSNYKEHEIKSFYNLIILIIDIGYKHDKKDFIGKILNSMNDSEDKKFLIHYYSCRNKLCYDDEINFQTLTDDKFLAIDKTKIHPIFIKSYNFFDLYIKYSKSDIININEKEFYDDIGGVNCDKVTRPVMIELCVEFKQLELAKKLMNIFTADQFGNDMNYFWNRYTILEMNKKVIVKEIDSHFRSNATKANLYYDLAAHHANSNSSLSSFLLAQINKLYNANLITRGGAFESKFSKLQLLIKVQKALKQKDVKSFEVLEKQPLPEVTEEVTEEKINKNHEIIENLKDKSSEKTIEQEDVLNFNKNNSSTEGFIPYKADEPDFENMSAQAIYRYYENERISKNLPHVQDIPCYLKAKEKRTNTKYQESVKDDVPWYYQGKEYNKNDCFKLDHTLPNGQLVKKSWAIIDPKIENEITNLKAVKQALEKEYIGGHKQNGAMYFKTVRGKKLAKITSNNDERVCSDLKVINADGEELIVMNHHFTTHNNFDNFCQNSNGFHYLDGSKLVELSGDLTY